MKLYVVRSDIVQLYLDFPLFIITLS